MADKPLWRRLADAVVELDDDQASPAPQTLQQAQPPAIMTATSAVAVTAVVDPQLQDALMKAALARKTIFSGLIESAERLRSVPGMDDTQRIKAAAAMSAGPAESARPDQITRAAQSHLSDIATERSKFAREIADAKVLRVDRCQAEAVELESKIEETKKQIAALQSGIDISVARVTELRTTASAAEADLAQKAAAFDIAAQAAEQYVASTRDSIISAIK